MNEEKINQILKNQNAIIGSLAKLIKEESKTILIEALDECYWDTIHLLNPKQETPLQEEMDKIIPDETQEGCVKSEETAGESK